MITQFTSYLRSIRGYSPRTADGYRKDCQAFASWAKANLNDARWSTITRADIDKYIQTRVKQGIKPSTTNRELAAISALYRYFQREGLLKDNPVKYESRRKQPQRQPNTIDIVELRQAYEHSYGFEKYALGILISTGIRISELLSLRWEDIDYKSGEVSIYGKGMKERPVFLSAEVLRLFQELPNLHEQQGLIFRITERDARYRIFQALKPYCHGKQLSPHAIRHTIATYWAKQGANVTTIAKALGHNRIATTQLYIDMAQSDTKALMHNNSLI